MKDLISVIVPVYNSERYIRSCVESALAQTYPAFELLLIEDGSSDHSLNICEALCEKDKRIRVIRQEHKGVSAARNLGIEAAVGKYLFFMDSDDLIHPRLLEVLYKLLKKGHAAMATEGMHRGKEVDFRKAAARRRSSHHMPERSYFDNKRALKHINKPEIYSIGGKMISRKMMGTVRFQEGLSQAEDSLFVYELIVNGADISVLRRNWYYYRKHENNASENFSLKTCQERYRAARYICSNESRSGRRENAVYREWDIIGMIAAWYRKGRMEQNVELVKLAKNFMREEKNRKIFRKLKWWMKLYYYLFLYCYPLEEVIRKSFIICR